MLAHEMITKVSALIGQCDLLIGMTEPGTAIEKKAAQIHRIGILVVDELKEHQRKADEERLRAG
jgi:hypothetical protein